MTFVSQIEIQRLAERIERAYMRRGGRFRAVCSTPRVWNAAATALWRCRLDDPELPVDPELYVAAQGIDADSSDPWADLASPQAMERFRRRVRAIVHQLQSELSREIRRAERSISRGREAVAVLTARDSRLSPLARYIVARKTLGEDLARRWLPGALEQHRSCPLYRNACGGFLSVAEYPSERDAIRAPARFPRQSACSLN